MIEFIKSIAAGLTQKRLESADEYFKKHKEWKNRRAMYLQSGYPSTAAYPAYDRLASSTEYEGEAFQGFCYPRPDETIEERVIREQERMDRNFGKGKVKVRLDPNVTPKRLDRYSTQPGWGLFISRA